MPVTITVRPDLQPPRLYNQFKITDEQGKEVGLTPDHIEASINQTIDQFLSQSPYLVIAEVHPGVSMLKTTGILFKRDTINKLLTHPNLLGLAVVDHRNSFFKLLIETAKTITPTLRIPVFKSLEELDSYIVNNPSEFQPKAK